MFNKILIANRGEIAVRIIRTCHKLGISTVAVHSTIDKDSLHVQLATEAVCIGGPSSKDSYLNMTNIIEAAVLTNAQAIHPGFGFLSENAEFARLCRDCNITFIGPSPEVIETMGNKSKAKEAMIDANVPVVLGSKGLLQSSDEAIEFARKVGYPVLMKASAGGGGRGMRIAYNDEECLNGYAMAKMEAKNAFGDDSLYIEKFIEDPRHIEFQILADGYGNVIHLGERDCSVQRRNQKMIEEAPSIALDDNLRKEMGQKAVLAAKAIDYENAGTIEFLLDKHNQFYFIEMNTRIQVEHPVTEFITGIDLIEQQIRIANKEKLIYKQDDIQINGHAIECRINAEDATNNFTPSPGKISFLNMPGGNGVRVDTFVYNGYTIPPTYDSMIAKLIVHGKNREDAIMKMRQALSEFVCDGVKNNIDFQLEILHNDEFVSGKYTTGFIKKEYSHLLK